MAFPVRQSCMLTDEQLEEVKAEFNMIDLNNDESISFSELGDALAMCGIKIPNWEVRKIIESIDANKDGKVSLDEFKNLYAQLNSERNIGHTFKKAVTKRENIIVHAGMTDSSVEGTTHSVRDDEQNAFSDWINRNLADDPDCQKYLPLNPDGSDLYEKSKDGILLCKMINKSQPDTIDERTINKTNLNVYKKHENLTLALNSAQSIGCNIVNIRPDDLEKGKPHLVLGLLWQIIRIGLLSDINLAQHPGLVMLLGEDETIEDLLKLSPEQILIRWVNYHLNNAPGTDREIANLTGDIKDSVAYIHLLSQIAPREAGLTTHCENEFDTEQRAELMLQNADKINCRSFVTPNDVVTGNAKLNLAFVANLFNTYPALEKPAEYDGIEIVEETRDERTYRNWMNSLGVSPFVNYLYSDLCDGNIYFQLYDHVKPGMVDWKRVHKTFHKMKAFMEKIENCNYVVELGKEIKFSLVGIQGSDINDGNQTLTLAIVWQLMRAYTLSILTQLAGSGQPISEKDIIVWANEKLKKAGKKSQVLSFQDCNLADGKILIDLIDAIKPHHIKYENVMAGGNDEERLKNAKYAISMARKMGARVYALPEDIVEVKQKMILTIFACLMARDLINKRDSLKAS